MKKRFMGVAAALIAVLAPSCVKENFEGGEHTTATRFYSDMATKTVLDEGQIKWVTGDKIKIYQNDKFSTFTSTLKEEESPSTYSEFEGYLPVVIGSLVGDHSLDFWSVYPSSASSDVSYDAKNQTMSMVYEPTQTAKAGSFANGSFLGVSRTRNNTFALNFKVVGSYLKFRFPIDGISRIEVIDGKGNGLPTTVTASWDQEKEDSLIITPNSKLTDTYTLIADFEGTGGPLAKDTDYYLSVPVCSLNGMKAKLYDVNENVFYEKSIEKEVVFERNKPKSMTKWDDVPMIINMSNIETNAGESITFDLPELKNCDGYEITGAGDMLDNTYDIYKGKEKQGNKIIFTPNSELQSFDDDILVYFTVTGSDEKILAVKTHLTIKSTIEKPKILENWHAFNIPSEGTANQPFQISIEGWEAGNVILRDSKGQKQSDFVARAPYSYEQECWYLVIEKAKGCESGGGKYFADICMVKDGNEVCDTKEIIITTASAPEVVGAESIGVSVGDSVNVAFSLVNAEGLSDFVWDCLGLPEGVTFNISAAKTSAEFTFSNKSFIGNTNINITCDYKDIEGNVHQVYKSVTLTGVAKVPHITGGDEFHIPIRQSIMNTYTLEGVNAEDIEMIEWRWDQVPEEGLSPSVEERSTLSVNAGFYNESFFGDCNPTLICMYRTKDMEEYEYKYLSKEVWVEGLPVVSYAGEGQIEFASEGVEEHVEQSLEISPEGAEILSIYTDWLPADFRYGWDSEAGLTIYAGSTAYDGELTFNAVIVVGETKKTTRFTIPVVVVKNE